MTARSENRFKQTERERTDKLTKAQRERQMMITLNNKLTTTEAAYAVLCKELQATKDEVERARDQHEALRNELARAVKQGETWKTDRDKWIKAFTEKDAAWRKLSRMVWDLCDRADVMAWREEHKEEK